MMNPKLFFALLVVATLSFTGCDSNGEDAYSEVLGRWEALDNGEEEDAYINIGNDEVVITLFFEDIPGGGSCYQTDTFEVVERAGNTWTVRDVDANQTETVEISRDGDELVVTALDIEDGDIVRFTRSTRTTFSPPCGIF